MKAINPRKWQDAKTSVFVGCVALMATFLTYLLVLVEGPNWTNDLDWMIFGIFGTLLFLAETQPNFTMKFGEKGQVSPGWTFTYALMLFGMPLPALVVLVIANLVASAQERKPPRIVLLNTSVLAASLAAGALVLHAFGVHGRMTALDTIPISWGVGIFLGAAAMLVLNGLLIAVAIGLHTGTGFITILRTGLAVSMTADGALLSLAPVFVIAIDFSLALVPLLASTSYLVIQSARRSLQRAHEASHDPLTDLLNRRAFHDRLGRTIGLFESERMAVVLVMDFDGFKDINDSLGHSVGDDLLVSFGNRLVESLPPTASAARLGGDEFAVLIPGTHTREEVNLAVEQLHAALVEPYDLDGFPLSMSVSIGAAIAPDDGRNAEDLLAAADLAMYRAKQFGSGVEHYESTGGTSKPSTSGVGRIGLLGSLSDAIEYGQLTNHYQPQVSTTTGQIETVEALVRWNHPEHGMIPPNEFIGMAEQTDLIDGLTTDVLERAMRDVLALDQPELSVAVNVSARSLHQRTFATSVLQSAADFGFPTDKLELEITERAIAGDPERIALTVGRLRDAGVRIAIDDFGTGYSSFASLRQIRTDRLKIDQQFTRHLAASPEDRLVVRTITELAHGLGLSVVAEGVETCDIWEHVKLLGCDIAQGYAIARPMPIDQLRTIAPIPVVGQQSEVRT